MGVLNCPIFRPFGGVAIENANHKTNTSAMTSLFPVIALMIALVFSAQGEPVRPQPNIIVVFIDDMGWTDLSCFGGKVETQHIDQLAQEGIRFTSFYVNAPICSPSRVALNTGQYPQRWRITSYLNNRKDNAKRGVAQWLDPKAPTLARALKGAGYVTGHFGKWHMGGQRDVSDAPAIANYGFDASLTNFEGMGPKLLPLTLKPGDKKPGKIWQDAVRLGEPVTWMQRSEITTGFVDAALGFIDQAEKENKPFYINVCPDDVHSPFFPPLDKWGPTKRDLYQGVLDAMDEQLAPLFDRVREDKNLRGNTLIVVCSDNGHEAGAGNSYPLRGAKTWLYEGGVRSPLIVWGPGLIDGALVGTTNSESIFCALDLNRSLHTLAGATPGADLDGEDLADTLVGKSKAGRVAPIFWRRPPDRPGFGHGLDEDNPDLAVRDGKWKYLVNLDGSDPQLYDLDTDAPESKNLATTRPDLAVRLDKAVRDWNATLPVDASDPAFVEAAPVGEKPNVLLILVDDLKPVLGCYGDKTAKTPHLDALAARGMRFDAAYCNQAVCAPSRFTLMLGSHSTSTGLYGLGSDLRKAIPDAVTLPQHFAKFGGYRTESLGKIFHVGHGNEGDPASFSVPHFKEKVVEYLDPASTDGGKLTREEALFTNQKLGDIGSLPRGAAFESPVAEDTDYADGRVADETIKRLKAAKKRRANDGTPFFIAAGFARPHLPFCAPKKYWDLYDPATLPLPENTAFPKGAPEVALKRGGEITAYKPVPENGKVDAELTRQLIHGYYASTSYVDAQIGKVMDELDRLGLADNTIIVLWGDHGFHLGDLGIWTKHTNYEQANRIPILITAPGVTKPNTATKQLAESVDLFPTLAELAGLPAPAGPQPIDGLSLVPVLKNPDARVRDHAYHAYPHRKLGRAIRTDRYRLVEWLGDDDAPETAEYELYDYETDPHETVNQAAERPEVVAELKAILARYPAPFGRKAKARATASPQIANQPLRLLAEVTAPDPRGVVLAQGGRENGYALHFVGGQPAFDVRLDGKVTRLHMDRPFKGTVQLEARLDAKEMSLRVNGETTLTLPSPGLIPVQPKDDLSIGQDALSAAGDYEAPNPFNGAIVNTRVETGAGRAPSAVAPVMNRATLEAGLASHSRALFVKEGWIRDPYIVSGPDGDFYLTGTTPNPGDPREQNDPYNTGLGNDSLVGWKAQVWRSSNLIDWEPLANPFSLKDGLWFTEKPEAFEKADPGEWRLWAPELHWLGDRWALVHTSPFPVAGANLSLSAGSEVKGPWSNPMGAAIGRRHDPSLFKDDDGTWWMVWGATSVAPLQPDFSGFAAEPFAIRPSGTTAKMGHEGCLIQKIHGKYVLFGTGWSTGEMRKGSYNLYYATADRIEGPYSERKFAGRFLGHGTPFQDKARRWWCTAFFNGNVPPVSADGIETLDLSETAQTINQRGTTLVPLEVRMLENGELRIRAKDPAYATPGPDEAQKF